MACIDALGVLYIEGRIDNQIKVNGFRIELAEIERHAADVACVKIAVATLEEGHGQKKGISLYLQCDVAGTDCIEKVKTHLRDCLPSYMQPAKISLCETFPLSTAGKIDRKRLIELFSHK